MNFLLKSTVMLLCILWLVGCQSIWDSPIPDGEIVYQGGYQNYHHQLGFVQADGDNNQLLTPDRDFEKPVWSIDGNFLYGLTGGMGAYTGYPAYWDIREGSFGVCNRNLPFFEQIQGSNNSENPYEVVVHHTWTIIKIDLSNCKQISTLVDYSTMPGKFSIAGFAYSPSHQKLVFGLIENPNPISSDQRREYRLLLMDLGTGENIRIGEGINPSWSPDGAQIAFIGLDGLDILETNSETSEPKLVVDHHFFTPSASGSPWSDISIPRWSPDGKWLVYHRCNTGKICTYEDAQIYKIPSAGGQEKVITQGGEYPSWRLTGN